MWLQKKKLKILKDEVLGRFQGRVKVPGFRDGKIPPNILEKNINQELLQSEFMEHAIEQLYVQAIQSQNIRPVDRPQNCCQKVRAVYYV